MVGLVRRVPGVRDALALAWRDRAWGRPAGVAPVRLGDGRVLDCDLDDHTQRKMALGSFERAETRLCRKLLRPGDLFVDVGAHIGWFATLAAVLVGPEGRVHAVEPFPSSFARLRKNASRSGLANLMPWPVAAGDRFGTARVAAQEGSDSGSVTTLRGQGVPVPRMPLDSLVDEDRPVRLLKIDVEGYEPAVLAGAPGLLARTDAVLVELNRPGLASQGERVASVTGPLREAGFTDQREILPAYSRLRSAGEVTNLLALRH